MDNRLMNERRPRLFWILDSKKGPEFRNQGYLTLSELGIGYRTSGVWKKRGKERKEKL